MLIFMFKMMAMVMGHYRYGDNDADSESAIDCDGETGGGRNGDERGREAEERQDEMAQNKSQKPCSKASRNRASLPLPHPLSNASAASDRTPSPYSAPPPHVVCSSRAITHRVPGPPVLANPLQKQPLEEG